MTPESDPFLTESSSPPSTESKALEASFLAPPLSLSDTEDASIEQPVAPPPSNRRWWMGMILIFAALGGIGWLVYAKVIVPMTTPNDPEFAPTAVTIEQPKTATIQDSTDYLATLDSRESVFIQPQAAGRISKIFVRSGDRVKAGAPLLRLDAEQQEAQVAGSQAEIDAASADIVAAKAEVESARRSLTALQSILDSRQSDLIFQQQEYERFKTLEAKGAATLQALQEKRSTLNQAKASVSEIQAQMSTQKALIARAQADFVRRQQQKDAAIATANQDQVQLRYYTISAPIEGTIGDIPAKVGDLVSESSTLLTLTQNQVLEIKIEVPQEDINRLSLGLPVQLLDTQNQILETGSVSYIAPNVSAQTQSVQVKARFNNSGGQLRTNQMIKARIISANRTGILVPTTAISRLAGKNFVFLAEPYGTSDCSQQGAPNQPSPDADQWVAIQKPIELGPIIKNSQDISKGISIGDRVITSGLLQLQHCMVIQPNP